MHLPSADATERLSIAASISVFLFFALMLSVPRGYTYGAILLLLCALYASVYRSLPDMTAEDKWLVWFLALVFCAGLFSMVYHDNRVRSLDLPTRYLLAVPILFLAQGVGLRLPFIWCGLILGAVSGAGVAYSQLHSMAQARAVGFTGVIQFGDLSLMMGVFCLAGLFWAATQKRHKIIWQVALLSGALAGAYGSIASGSRGGWVASPLILILFAAALVNRRNVKRAIAITLVASAGLAVVAVTVPSVKQRYYDTVSDIQQYRQGKVDTSLGARFAIWRAVATMIADKPLLGWSDADYREQLQYQSKHGGVDRVVTRLANTHNMYLEIWIFQGLAGLLPLCGLLCVALIGFCRRLRHHDPSVQSVALCGANLVTAYAVFSMSQIMLGRNNTLLFFVIALVVMWGSMRRRENSQVKGPQA